ncbi:MAG: amidohydrolase family protein [Bdellovibrionales bacterium]|nr:amidohydrolase family protein [Bdellovibrionales bacterium]
MSKRHFKILIYSIVVWVTLASVAIENDLAFVDHSKTWIISGFSYDDLDGDIYAGDRIWVLVHRGRIQSVSKIRPNASNDMPLITTNDWIFPGFIDMHNHIFYNMAPLWNQAKGQFLNRYEWRNKSKDYKKNLRALKPFKTAIGKCVSVRYAELKALAGGTTTIQGVGGYDYQKCAQNFGIQNFEIKNEFITEEILKSSVDPLNAPAMKAFFDPIISPQLQHGKTYLEAYEAAQYDEDVYESFEEFQEAIKSHEEALEQYEDNLEQGLLGLEEPTAPEAPFTEKQMDEINAQLIYDKRVDAARRSMEKHFEKNNLGLFAHVAEGMHDDLWNQREFGYLRSMGWVQKNFILIHALGLTKEDLRYVAKKGAHIVWSPFSNLLLYGETLDMKAVKESGVNVSIGPDWSLTGSKNVFDEVKFAKKYLDKFYPGLYTEKELVNMITVNAAKAVGLQGNLGTIAEGAIANLVLLKKDSESSAYTQFFNSDQEDISLVITNGKPLYGDYSILKTIQQRFNDNTKIEELPSVNCQLDQPKAYRLPYSDDELELPEFKTLSSILKKMDELRVEMTESTRLSRIDPILDCEHLAENPDDYKYRWNHFVDLEIQFNHEHRKELRKADNLDDHWSPSDDHLW